LPPNLTLTGIYFTTYALYAYPYFSTKEDPGKSSQGKNHITKLAIAIIISWIIPGNVYPVIENPKMEGNIVG
jgi:hypothetical protein